MEKDNGIFLMNYFPEMIMSHTVIKLESLDKKYIIKFR